MENQNSKDITVASKKGIAEQSNTLKSIDSVGAKYTPRTATVNPKSKSKTEASKTPMTKVQPAFKASQIKPERKGVVASATNLLSNKEKEQLKNIARQKANQRAAYLRKVMPEAYVEYMAPAMADVQETMNVIDNHFFNQLFVSDATLQLAGSDDDCAIAIEAQEVDQ